MPIKNRIFLSKTELGGYRSIEDVRINFVPGLNIIIGKNAVGKTNFLNFLNNSLNFDFERSNNFHSKFQIVDGKNYYDFSFTKKTSINTNTSKDSKEKFDFLGMRRFRPNFKGQFNINGTKTTPQEFQIEDEGQIHKFRDILRDECVSIKSIFIKHGIPQNYFIIDSALNVELVDGNISDDFINLLNSNIQSNFFKTLLFASLTLPAINKEYFNKRLKNKLSIENFINTKKSEYKESVLKDLEFLSDLKKVLNEYSPIENIRLSESFFIDIDIQDEKITLKNFYLEYFVDGRWYTFEDLSDGTKRIFYIISEIFILDRNYYHSEMFKDFETEKLRTLNVIFIEEPELGIHPHQLFSLMRFIKEKSRTCQIIVTTHSPLTLDILDKDELNSIIIASKLNGLTTLQKLDKNKIKKAELYMEELNLSDFWLHSDLE